MSNIDYYKTLGVSESASESEIKKAFHKLAYQYHPDRPGGNEQKFKEINEAYQVLTDKKAKNQYDTYRQYGGSGSNFNSGFDGFSGFQNTDFGSDFGFNINDIFTEFFNQRYRQKNEDIELGFDISLEESSSGLTKDISYKRFDGNRVVIENLNIKVPSGIKNNDTIKFANKGQNKFKDVPTGNLLIHIRIKPHKVFERRGDDLFTKLEINSLQAILGVDKEIKDLDGKEILVHIPKGIDPNTILKLKEKGIKHLHQSGTGDLYITVIIKTPKRINHKTEEILKNLEKELD